MVKRSPKVVRSAQTEVRGSSPQDEFLLRYYRWALGDSRREFSEGFPLVNQISSTNAFDFLEFVESLAPSQREPFSRGLVKRFHPRACEILGESLSSSEEASLARYLHPGARLGGRLGVAVLGQREKQLLKEELAGKVNFQIDRKRLRTEIIKCLSPVLGGKYEPWGEWQVWKYTNVFDGWKLSTYVDVGGHIHQLCYHHVLGAPNNCEVHPKISLLGWLGIAGNTHWESLTERETSRAAASLAQICAHFLAALPVLLKDL